MADFLASFDFGAGDDHAPDSGACVSIDSLQIRLRGLIDAKTTDTRAEHIGAAVDLAEKIEFVITPAQARNDVPNNVDPSLSGEAMDIDEAIGSQSKVHTALEVLRNQPSQEPVVQQAVAEQIAMAVGVEDKSTWALQSCELASHGWDFTFICEASLQHWKAQHEGQTLAVVGDYSKKEPDPVLSSRPAFDCRGRLFISFSRKARTVSLKYDHTILHKTVADLAEFLKPPPIFGPHKPDHKTLVNLAKLAQDEAAKTRRRSKPKEGRRRKKKGTEQAQAHLSLTEQAAQALEYAGMSQLHQTVAMEDRQSGNAYVAGNSGGESVKGQGHSSNKLLSLNVTPEEAARRADVATRLLTEAGVHLGSLSADQFNIFANQSPELQKESLNMLVTYGAERLQIVQPSNNKENGVSAPPSDLSASGEAAGSAAQTTTTELVLEDPTLNRKRAKSSRPPGKSRLACFQCKSRKVKCPKGRPACMECQNNGLTCEFPAQKPRNRKAKSDAAVAEDAEAEANGDETAMTETNGDSAHAEAAQNGGLGADTGMSYSYREVSEQDHRRESAHDPIHGFHHQSSQLPYFQSASGLSLSQPDPLDNSSPRPQFDSAATLPGSSVHYPSYPVPSSTQAPEPRRQPQEPAPFRRNMTSQNNGVRDSNNSTINGISPRLTWAQNNHNNNEVSETTAAHVSPPSQHSHPNTRGSDTGIVPAHINIQDTTLLAEAASQQQQPYAPNSGMKRYRPNSGPKTTFQSSYSPQPNSQQGYKPPSVPPQRPTSAFQRPADKDSSMQSNSLHSRSSMSMSSTTQYGGHKTGDADGLLYKPSSFQSNGSGGHSASTSTGTYASSPAHAGLRPGQGVSGIRQDQHGYDQHIQNWQYVNQAAGGNGQGQRQQGYSWGMEDGWNSRH